MYYSEIIIEPRDSSSPNAKIVGTVGTKLRSVERRAAVTRNVAQNGGIKTAGVSRM
jgi:hypothetical protein